jgi:hypothetical protein
VGERKPEKERETAMKYDIPRKKYSDAIMAKGACWYCNAQLDDVKRFCNRNCAEAFEEDELAMERSMQAARTRVQEASHA